MIHTPHNKRRRIAIVQLEGASAEAHYLPPPPPPERPQPCEGLPTWLTLVFGLLTAVALIGRFER